MEWKEVVEILASEYLSTKEQAEMILSLMDNGPVWDIVKITCLEWLEE